MWFLPRWGIMPHHHTTTVCIPHLLCFLGGQGHEESPSAGSCCSSGAECDSGRQRSPGSCASRPCGASVRYSMVRSKPSARVPRVCRHKKTAHRATPWPTLSRSLPLGQDDRWCVAGVGQRTCWQRARHNAVGSTESNAEGVEGKRRVIRHSATARVSASAVQARVATNSRRKCAAHRYTLRSSTVRRIRSIRA